MEKMNKVLRSHTFYEAAFIAVIAFSLLLWLAAIFKNGFHSSQFDLFFGRCADFFADMINCVGYSSQKDVYHNTMYTGTYEKIYPALPYIITYCFSKLVDMSKYWEANYFLHMYQEPFFLIIFLIFLFVVLLMIYECIRFYKNGNSLVKIGCAAACVLSMPVIFTIERGNLLLVSEFFLMYFIFFYDNGNKIVRETALFALAAAFAFKLTPAVFGILLLYDRKIKEAVRAAVYALFLGVVPFLFFEGGLSNIRTMFQNISDSGAAYTDATGTPLYACFLALGMEGSDPRRQFIRIVTYVVCLLIVLGGFWGSKWEKAMGVSIVLMILPSRSGSYCIIYLIPAMILFLNEAEHRISDLLVLFAILLCMYHIQWPGRQWFDYHLGIILLMLLMMCRGIYRMYIFLKDKKIGAVLG